MSGVRASAAKDLRRRMRDPVSLAMWCGIPLVIATLMTLAFGGAGSERTPTAHVLVADLDGSFVSDLLAAGLGRAGDLFVVEAVGEAEGRARMDDGDATALLVIPAGFGQALVDGVPTELQLVTNPAQQVLPGIVEGALSVMADAAFYAQELLGDELRLLSAGPPEGRRTFPSLQIAQLSVRVNELVTRVVALLDPPLIELETTIETDEGGDGAGGLGAYMFPGILVMAIAFVAQGLSEDMWRERDGGTLRRFLVSRQPLSAFLRGKVLAAAALLALVVLVGLGAAFVAFDAPAPALLLAWPWLVLLGVVLFALFVLLQVLASSARGGNTLTNMLVFPMLMLGGSFMPFVVMEQSMPGWLVAVGRHTPNGWALGQLEAILASAASARTLALGALGMVSLAALLLALADRRLRAFARAG